MKESKIATILRSLGKQELKSLENFINSPFFAPRRNIAEYFRVLKKYHPEFEISREKLYEKLYPGERFSEIKLYNLASQLIKLAEGFIVHTAVEKDRKLYQKTLIKEYKRRGSEKLFWQNIKREDTDPSGILFSSAACFNDSEELKWIKSDHLSEMGRFEESFNERIEYTDLIIGSFLIRLFRRFIEKRSTETYNVKFETTLLKAVLEHTNFDAIVKDEINSNDWLSVLIRIYYLAYKSYYDLKNEHYYYDFKRLFYENIDRFTPEEKFTLFDDLLSTCTEKRLAGNSEFNKEQFVVYKEMIEKEGYISDGGKYMSVVLYRNIVFIALIQIDYKWLKHFIDNYSEKLRIEFQENMKNHALAHLHFETGDPENALVYSSKVVFDFFIYKLDIKHLLLKIYYELDMTEQAYSMIDTYRHFLRESNELPDYHKKYHVDFIAVYVRLMRAKETNDLFEADKIDKEIKEQKAVLAGVWTRKMARIILGIK